MSVTKKLMISAEIIDAKKIYITPNNCLKHRNTCISNNYMYKVIKNLFFKGIRFIFFFLQIYGFLS